MITPPWSEPPPEAATIRVDLLDNTGEVVGALYGKVPQVKAAVLALQEVYATIKEYPK